MNYTLLVVITGTVLLGIISGSLGCFAVLRKQSLLGDAISHAALPGICIAFLLMSTKHPLVLVIGAMISGWLGALILSIVTDKTSLKKDAVLGIILSVFFGFGLALLTYIQRLPSAQKSGLNQYLFGSASTLLLQDLWVMGLLGGIVLLLLILFWKEFKIITFDPIYAASLGYRVRTLDILMTLLIVVAIVIGLQTVGVVLMSALVIAPAVAARQWTDKLSTMVIIAGLFGGVSGVSGSLISGSISRIPTGPIIVVIMSIIVIFSLFLAPLHGLVWEWLQHKKNRTKIYEDRALYNLWILAKNHKDLTHAHSSAAFEALGQHWITSTLKKLLASGHVYQNPDNHWGLTQKGLQRAQQISQHYGDASNG